MEIIVACLVGMCAWLALLRRADSTMPKSIVATIRRSGGPTTIRAHSWDVLWDPGKPGDPSSLDGPGRATYWLDPQDELVHLEWKPRNGALVVSSGPVPPGAASLIGTDTPQRSLAAPLIVLTYGTGGAAGAAIGAALAPDSFEGALIGVVLAIFGVWAILTLVLRRSIKHRTRGTDGASETMHKDS